MKTFYSIENNFENFEYCIREWFCAAGIRSYNKSDTNGCLTHLS